MAHVHAAVAAFQVALEVAAEERRPARTEDAEVGCDNALFERRGRDDDLERRSRRVASLQRAVLQRPQLVRVQRRPRGAVDPDRERVRIVRREAHEREHLARVRIEHHRGAVVAEVLEPVLRRLLEIGIDGELEAAALDRRLGAHLVDLTAEAVHDDDAIAIGAHQVLIERLLDARLPDRRARLDPLILRAPSWASVISPT